MDVCHGTAARPLASSFPGLHDALGMCLNDAVPQMTLTLAHSHSLTLTFTYTHTHSHSLLHNCRQRHLFPIAAAPQEGTGRG